MSVSRVAENAAVVIIAALPPQYIRDTIIVGGHATVAVVPATLTPVDSATACTTSVPSVDEGWRVDSIVHYSGGVRVSAVAYPATQITYLIIGNTIDSVFTSEIPVIPDSSNISFSQPANGTITIDPVALRRAAGDTTRIVFIPATHYHFGGWTGGLADSTNDTVNYVFPAAGTVTFSAVAWIDTHTVTLVDGDNVNLTALNGTAKPWGAVCSVAVRCSTGYVWRVESGLWRSVQDTTLLITVGGDTTVTAGSLMRPVIDSIRKNPNYRNDSSSIYLRGGSTAGIIRNLTTGTNVLQKYWSATRIDVYTGNWSRGWHQIRVTTEDSLRDTASLYIAIPRKTN